MALCSVTVQVELLFNSPKANRDIYETKANAKKGRFYDMYPRKTGYSNTWDCTDRVKHARKRRILNAALSDKALKSSENYIIKHADRWCELLLDGGDHEWSSPRNMADWSDRLVFDILGKPFNLVTMSHCLIYSSAMASDSRFNRGIDFSTLESDAICCLGAQSLPCFRQRLMPSCTQVSCAMPDPSTSKNQGTTT